MDSHFKKGETKSKVDVISHVDAFATKFTTESVSKFRNLIVVEASKKLLGKQDPSNTYIQ